MIRKVEVQDYARIYELGTQLHFNFKNNYQLEELLKKSYFKILVFVESNYVTGFISYTEIADTIDVIDLFVDKYYRHQKMASNLLDYMITNSTPGGQIYLEVETNNDAAISLYEKFGFQKIHTRQKYYGEYDAYVMERKNKDEGYLYSRD